MNSTEVLIVGAGPVGLAAANVLAQHGAKARIIDRLPVPTHQSRAAAIHARSLELLERLGLVEKFIAAGTWIHGARLYDDKARLLGAIHLEQIDSPYPGLLGLGQTMTERLLAEALDEHGITVERRVELVRFAQDGDGVTATLARADGTEETARCRYLIGCDGGKSTVRHQLGLKLEGETLDAHWITADCHVDWEFSGEEAIAFMLPAGFMFAMAIEDGRWRFISAIDRPLPEGQEARLEDVQSICDQLLPVPVRLHSPHWVGQFGINTRLTPTMQVGRVFLCGDAAHVHSPVGGQGMNTGIQDAFNLCWKLALAIAGPGGNDALIKSFNDERHSNAKRMLGEVGPGTRIVNLRHPVATAIRSAIAHFALQFDAVRSRLQQSVAELDVHYRHSPIVEEHLGPIPRGGAVPGVLASCADFGKGPRPGERAPDIHELRPFDGSEGKRLFQMWVRDPRSQILVFLADAEPARIETLRAGLADLRKRFGKWVETTLIHPGSGLRDAWCDGDGSGHHRYGARHESLYLIRPDGYVGFRSQPADTAALVRHLQELYSKNHSLPT
jgi:2-polyprenyl-6-methoxyphenol hydroxylase-like FAD-dependent oxidoreductase